MGYPGYAVTGILREDLGISRDAGKEIREEQREEGSTRNIFEMCREQLVTNTRMYQSKWGTRNVMMKLRDDECHHAIFNFSFSLVFSTLFIVHKFSFPQSFIHQHIFLMFESFLLYLV